MKEVIKLKNDNINFETIKFNKNRLYLLGGFVCVVVLMVTIFIGMSQSKYRNTQSIPLINGTITFNNADLNVIAMYQENDLGEYESIDTVPNGGYLLDYENSYCEVNGEKDSDVSLIYDNGRINVSFTKKGTKCYLYFNAKCGKACRAILANKAIQERTSFSSTLKSNTNGTIYQAPEGEGTSYYFAGSNTENWLSFAGFYWRIIRINSNGTVRIIYNGTSNGATGSETQLSSTSAFNGRRNNNMYVGYMYTSGEIHGLGTSSTIKGVVDTWYQNNIANNTDYTSKISTINGFCGDRSNYTDNTGTTSGDGTGTTVTYYGAYIRLITNTAPTYDCANDSDLYTVDGAGIGNEALTYPIGLITIDEVAYAGGAYDPMDNNTSYYLYTNQDYWTMSPYYFRSSTANGFYVGDYGYINWSDITDTYGVRPVINLNADVELSGTGTASDPFIVN